MELIEKVRPGYSFTDIVIEMKIYADKIEFRWYHLDKTGFTDGSGVLDANGDMRIKEFVVALGHCEDLKTVIETVWNEAAERRPWVYKEFDTGDDDER